MWGVPQVEGGSEEYLITSSIGRQLVVSISYTERKLGVSQIQGRSEKYLRYRDDRRSISGTGRIIPSNIELDKADLVKQKWAVGENKELVQQSRSLRLRQIRGAFLEYVQRIKNPCFSLQIF
jgi:hypothetical protein